VNSWIVRLCNAAVMLCVSIGSASAARPAPQYADVVITYAGQTFGFAGPLRAFAASESGGRISLDLTTLSTPGYAPRRTSAASISARRVTAGSWSDSAVTRR